MSASADNCRHDKTVQTFVSVYLADGRDDSIFLVCDAVSEMQTGSSWQRALDALARPEPRGPYAVSAHFKIVFYETFAQGAADGVVKTHTVEVSCSGTYAYAFVRVGESESLLSPIAYLIGDDVITIARQVLASAAGVLPSVGNDITSDPPS